MARKVDAAVFSREYRTKNHEPTISIRGGIHIRYHWRINATQRMIVFAHKYLLLPRSSEVVLSDKC